MRGVRIDLSRSDALDEKTKKKNTLVNKLLNIFLFLYYEIIETVYVQL